MRDRRQRSIVELLEKSNWLTVKYLSDKLDVSEMTIRRDLSELEDTGEIIRLHGGAKIVSPTSLEEISHETKKTINIKLKENIAKKIANEINDHEIIFLGGGTTIEMACKYLDDKSLKIVTNSLFVFLHFKDSKTSTVVLIGGNYRRRTGSFTGIISDTGIQHLRVEKAFVGVNAIDGNTVTNYNQEEGNTQTIALDNAKLKYIVADHTKLGKIDFFHFYDLDKADYLIVDDETDSEIIDEYSEFTTII